MDGTSVYWVGSNRVSSAAAVPAPTVINIVAGALKQRNDRVAGAILPESLARRWSDDLKKRTGRVGAVFVLLLELVGRVCEHLPAGLRKSVPARQPP